MVDVLLSQAGQIPDHPAFCFLIDGETEGPRITYAELDRQARSIAVTLRESAEPGDRAILLYAPGLAFISAFFGCMYAGVIPVPTYPPRFTQGWQGLSNLAVDCRPKLVLLDDVLAPFIPSGSQLPALADAERIVTDHIDHSNHCRWREPTFNADATALLQYTSGTTTTPRGVEITHRSLMHNEAVIHSAFEHLGPGVGVCWLPPYHDMGLIGGLLQSIYHGAVSYLMSPVSFIQDPARWLKAASKYRADTSGGPNFAYDLCVQRIPPERRAGLDLSRWSVAGIGAEPIQAETMNRFVEAFGPYGFRRESFCPCYGLAEATLMVTSNPKSDVPAVLGVHPEKLETGIIESGNKTIVGCGQFSEGIEVQIVDTESRLKLSSDRIGEIWIRSESTAKGYWNRPAETEETFHAVLADTGEGPYLRTGDLGFIHDGELFVTGRIKDVIIIRGRNHNPLDLEQTIQSVHPGLRKGSGAAFEYTVDDRIGIVAVQEVDRKVRDFNVNHVLEDARHAVAEHHQLQLHDLVFIEYGSIPKTSSGKIRRATCRQDYLRGGFRRWGRGVA